MGSVVGAAYGAEFFYGAELRCGGESRYNGSISGGVLLCAQYTAVEAGIAFDSFGVSHSSNTRVFMSLSSSKNHVYEKLLVAKFVISCV